MRDSAPGAQIAVVESAAQVGGGSSPAEVMASAAVRIEAPAWGESRLAEALRAGEPPVVARVQEGGVLLDLRSVLPEEDASLAAAAARAISKIVDEAGGK